MKNEDIFKWIVIGALGMIILAGIAYSIQRPNVLRKVPIFAPSPTPTPIASGNIIVTSPTSGEHVSQQFILAGKARVFENTVNIRLRDQLTGATYLEATLTTQAKNMGQFGNFKSGIPINNPNIRPGTKMILDVFQTAPKDGSETDKVSIPVIFSPQPE